MGRTWNQSSASLSITPVPSLFHTNTLTIWMKSLNDSNPNQAQRLNTQEICDFELCKKILAKAKEGVTLNGLVCRLPTRIGFSDSCPLGFGG